MTERDRLSRNARRLSEIHHPVRPKFRAVLRDLEGHGLRPRIQCAYRTIAEQKAAFQSGHSRVRWGLHCAVDAHGAPDALAADVLDDDAPTKPGVHFLAMLMRAARAHGLSAPLSWDPCHIQVTGLSLEEARRGERPDV